MADHVIIKTSLTPIIDMTDSDAENKLAILNNSNWTFGTIGTSDNHLMNPDFASSREANDGGPFNGSNTGQTDIGKCYIKHTGKTITGATTNQILYILRQETAYQAPLPTASTGYVVKILPNTSFVGDLNGGYYYWMAEFGGVADDTPVIQYWYEEM
tara:strand:- start:1944 stop:2414 length:471 start_codon:yes stop_codon:yes gene_type:complete